MSNLKIATMDDVEHIKRMSFLFALNSPYAHLPIDLDKMDDLIDQFVNGDKNTKILLLAMHNGVPVGQLAAATGEVMLSKDKIAMELMWWMDPEHRSSRLAFELIEAYEFWAKKVGCKIIQLSTVETEQTERIAKFYSRRGYTLTERSFIKEID